MDKQNSNNGNAGNIGNQGSGSSMGKDLSKDLDHVGSKGAGFGDLDKAMEKSDKTAAPATSPSSSSAQDKTSSLQSSSQDKSSSPSSSLDKSSAQDKSGSTGSTFSGANIDQTLDKTATTAHSTIDKALGAAAPLAERIATSAHAGVDKVSNALSGVSGNMDEKTRQLTDAYGKFADTGREYVRTSPATSVAVALAAGYVLAKLFGGRR